MSSDLTLRLYVQGLSSKVLVQGSREPAQLKRPLCLPHRVTYWTVGVVFDKKGFDLKKLQVYLSLDLPQHKNALIYKMQQAEARL